MSTCATIITNGLAKSAAARPETTSSAQRIARVGQCLREAFQVLARENPYVTGATVSVAFGGTGWLRPPDAMRVIKVNAGAGVLDADGDAIPVGTRLNIVPFDDQEFCAGLPSLTELGQQFIPTGQLVDPASGPMTVTYARAPNVPAAAGDAIDPFFPSFLDDLLQYDLAAYLASQDGRESDMQDFLGFKNGLMAQLIDWATQQTYDLQQRFLMVSPPLTNTNSGRSQPAKNA